MNVTDLYDGSSFRVSHLRTSKALRHEAGRRQARQVGEGGGKVVVQDHLVATGARRNSWPPDDEGHPYVLFVGGLLAETKAMLAHVIAVVAGEDDVGIVQLAGLFERPEQPADGLAHPGHRPQPLAIELVDMSLLRGA